MQFTECVDSLIYLGQGPRVKLGLPHDTKLTVPQKGQEEEWEEEGSNSI